ncbi:hypothetical protein TNCV_3591531 [Trichonephila clavipes]|nr:hypothetical protein TNCV_3591531 [Trichonephila clavipes]
MKFRLISSPAIRSCRVQQLTPIPTQTMIPGAGPVWRCITQQFRSLSPRVSKLESDHRDIAGKIDILKGKRSNESIASILLYYTRCRMAQNEIAVVPDFHKRILFSDEAHFWLNGYVNKQNGRIWSEANPQVYVETPLHPEKLTVWCALWAGGILLQKR